MPTGSTDDRLVLIARELMSCPIEQTTPERVVTLAVEHVQGCDLASITFRCGAREIETPAASEPLAELLDQLQYISDDGPCLNPPEDGDVHLSRDLAADHRWPQWSLHATSAGIRSLLSISLATPERVLGNLTMYGRRAAAFTDDSIDTGMVYARMASKALVAGEKASGLRATLESRHLISIAQGMLMSRYGLTRDQSFEVLRRHSRESGIPLRDIAAELVEQGDRTGTERPVRRS